jgi:hypothetical protein
LDNSSRYNSTSYDFLSKEFQVIARLAYLALREIEIISSISFSTRIDILPKDTRDRGVRVECI